MAIDQEKIKRVLTDTVLALCQTGIVFQWQLKIEGLLGLTLDEKDIFLINFNEVIKQKPSGNLPVKQTNKRRAEDSLPGEIAPKKRATEGLMNSPDSSFAHKRTAYPYVDSKGGYAGNLNGNGPLGSLQIPVLPPEMGTVNRMSPFPFMYGNPANPADKHGSLKDKPSTSLLSPYDSKRLQLFENQNNGQIQTQKHYPDGREVKREIGMFSPRAGIPPQFDFNLSSEKEARAELASHMAAMNVPLQLNPMFQELMKGQIANPSLFHPYAAATAVAAQRFASSMHYDMAKKLEDKSQVSKEKTPQKTQHKIPLNLTVVGGTGEMQMVEIKPNNTPYASQKVYSSDLSDYNDSMDQSSRKITSSDSSNEAGSSGKGRPRKSNELRRFRCDLCGASSSRKFNLQRHMKSHHPGCGDAYISDILPKKGDSTMLQGGESESECSFSAAKPSASDSESNLLAVNPTTQEFNAADPHAAVMDLSRKSEGASVSVFSNDSPPPDDLSPDFRGSTGMYPVFPDEPHPVECTRNNEQEPRYEFKQELEDNPAVNSVRTQDDAEVSGTDDDNKLVMDVPSELDKEQEDVFEPRSPVSTQLIKDDQNENKLFYADENISQADTYCQTIPA